MSVTIIVGDLHLGASTSIGKPGIGTILNSRILDQFKILDWIFDLAIKKQATNIIATGDIFEDPRPQPSLVSLFIFWLQKCSDNNISVHLCKGNHDIIRSGQHNTSAFDIISASNIDGIVIYNDISTFELPEVSFTILPFRDRRSFDTNSNSEALKIIQDRIRFERCGIDNRTIKIAVGHFALVGSLPVGNEIDDMHNELFLPLETFGGYDFTFLGHIHKPQVLLRKPYISHIGSMDLSNFSENNQAKVIAIIDTDSKDIMELVDIPSRPLKQISVSIPSEVTDTTSFTIDQINSQEQNLNGAIVKVSIAYESPDSISIDRTTIEDAVMKLGAFHIPRIDQERKVIQIKKIEGMEGIDNTVNESVAIKMYAGNNIDESFRNDFITLANSIVSEIKE